MDAGLRDTGFLDTGSLDTGSLDAGSFITCQTPACGGDDLGSWSIIDTCTQPVPIGAPDCTGMLIDMADVTFTGQANYHPNLTYEQSITMSGSYLITIPNECLGGVLTCKNVEDALRSDLDLSLYTGVTCTPFSQRCSCRLFLRSINETDFGTYQVENQELIRASATGSVSRNGHCVQGNGLSLDFGDASEGINA